MVDDNGGGNGGGDVPWPWSIKLMPFLIEELLKKKVRIIFPGDKINPVSQPGRVTIYITKNQRIYDIHIEPPPKQDLINIAEELKQNGPGDDPIPYPYPLLSGENDPILIKELLGRIVRFVHNEDLITEEHLPGRVTIYITEDQRIGDIKIESDKATK